MLAQLNPADQYVSSSSIQEFYNPLTPVRGLPLKSTTKPPPKSFKLLFTDEDRDEDEYEDKFNSLKMCNQSTQSTIEDDPNLLLILKKKKLENQQKPTAKTHAQVQSDDEYYSFNNQEFVPIRYPQTPHFRSQLFVPFAEFTHQHRHNIDYLKSPSKDQEVKELSLSTNPSLFLDCKLAYFNGLIFLMKTKNLSPQIRFLNRLACYVEPFNVAAWQKYISFEQQQGAFEEAHNLSKTAFLFTQSEIFMKMYVSTGEKCRIAPSKLRGIISSCSEPDRFEKSILFELAKIHMRNGEIEVGLKVLMKICQWNSFKISVCSVILFLAKYLQNIGERAQGLKLLRRSFGKGMSKLEIYTTYLEMSMRDTGTLSPHVVEQIFQNYDFIASENRYRLYLQLAEIKYSQWEFQEFRDFIAKAHQAAEKYCPPGLGANKIYKIIYYSVVKLSGLCIENPDTDQAAFEVNRWMFMSQKSFIDYPFQDWRFYLHYGLEKDEGVLKQACVRFPLTGRLVAEWIHCLRGKLSPLQTLEIWQQKIKEIPKSGELLCEGGRIYADLGEYQYASQCFKTAMHFTPQYGDSFIEELRLLLMRGNFLAIDQLQKSMFVAEPFYGHSWSFIRSSSPRGLPFCLKDIWETAVQTIKSALYNQNQRSSGQPCRRQTAFEPYNQAYESPHSQALQLKARLFESYEHTDNRG